MLVCQTFLRWDGFFKIGTMYYISEKFVLQICVILNYEFFSFRPVTSQKMYTSFTFIYWRFFLMFSLGFYQDIKFFRRGQFSWKNVFYALFRNIKSYAREKNMSEYKQEMHCNFCYVTYDTHSHTHMRTQTYKSSFLT